MMKKKIRAGKKHVLNAKRRTNLLALIEQICKWLNDSAGLLPAEITLQISPADFATTAAELSDERLVARARTLRGEARRIERGVLRLPHDHGVASIANNLRSLLDGLDDLLRSLQ